MTGPAGPFSFGSGLKYASWYKSGAIQGARWGKPPGPNNNGGFYVGGFLNLTEGLFNKLEGTRQERIAQFKTLCFWAYATIKARTPVSEGDGNAEPGHARDHWTIEFEETEDTVRCSIKNPVHYVVYLEYGHSDQAPEGMVRITMAEVSDKLNSSDWTPGTVPQDVVPTTFDMAKLKAAVKRLYAGHDHFEVVDNHHLLNWARVTGWGRRSYGV